MINDKIIPVTSPLLPPLEEFMPYLQNIWDSKRITNNGQYHRELEQKLCDHLGVEFISLFTNGTFPLLAALQALDIKGEVITTPFSFAATTHSLILCGLKPVFADVDEKNGNLDPDKIEAAITKNTTAIMPVHVYGTPCNTDLIRQIASKYGLKVIYDAAHAFGVEKNGKSVLSLGDISTLSFHATKTYNTAEGGALVCHNAEIKQKIDCYKNFGLSDENDVIMTGINGKMDEIRAALGILNLKYVNQAIEKRKEISRLYRRELLNINGITMFNNNDSGIKYNYSYFPVFIDKDEYGICRDELNDKLKSYNIITRKYFYPLISNFEPYKNIESAKPSNLPIASKLSQQVLCLPIYADLDFNVVNNIIQIITENSKK